jgi:CRISPR-associated endonuclease Csn1
MERGLLYMSDDGTPCALTAAGYLRPDQQPRKVLPELPEPPDIANPVVRQAMFEVRKVVNAIIREHGKPARIHVELARDATKSQQQRQEDSKRRQENEDRRSEAADLIRSNGFKVSRDGIDRVLLCREQGETCVYSGRSISMVQLLQGEVDIDHILPYSRCLDDSMQNKVVAFRGMNQEKGNRTPREWLESDPERYEKILKGVSKLPYSKRKRFTQKELDLDSFVQRQLNDTRYIARALSQYLRCLVTEPHHVLCPKGSHTAELRRHWGLGTVLQNLPDSPAWTGENELRDGEKNRADHRHHAIDALVIALTDASRLQTLARIRRQGGTQNTGEVLPDPWPRFRETVIEAIKGINVSHRVQRRVSGALHEDTLYGPVRDKNIRGGLIQRPGEFVVRKPLESLTCSMIEDIRDPTIRDIVIARLNERKVSFGRGIKGGIPKEVWTPQLKMKSGVPIRKVRLIKRDETIQPIRAGTAFVKPGSTHHLCIFEWTENGKKKREAIFVTMLEAIQRIRRKEPIISRVHPSRPNAHFVMSLSAGEAVVGPKGDGQLMIFSTAASTQGQVYFNRHTDARRSSDRQKIVVTANSMDRNARKVTVDPLGRIRWAND